MDTVYSAPPPDALRPAPELDQVADREALALQQKSAPDLEFKTPSSLGLADS